MTNQNELSDNADALLRKGRWLIQPDHPDYNLCLDLAHMGYLVHAHKAYTEPMQHEFFTTRKGRRYLAQLDAPAQPEQTRMEQFKQDYPEIDGLLRNICKINQALEVRYSELTDLVNDITPESQVRQELRVAIETIADYLPRCQKQASRFNPAQIEILDAFLGGLLFEAELDGVTENNSDFVYAEFGRRVVASAKHYQAMVNAAREDKVES